MAKYALVIDDRIDTISIDPVEGWIEVPDDVFAGFVKQGGAWVAPAPEPEGAADRGARDEGRG